jgi:hypothetical protein
VTGSLRQAENSLKPNRSNACAIGRKPGSNATLRLPKKGDNARAALMLCQRKDASQGPSV